MLYRSCRNTFPSSAPISLTDWSRPTEATNDYFNACNAGGLSVPSNMMGPQMARTGDVYVGYIAHTGASWLDEYHEYVQARLSSSLVAGHRYYVGYWISLGEWFNIYELDYPTPVAGVDGMVLKKG